MDMKKTWLLFLCLFLMFVFCLASCDAYEPSADPVHSKNLQYVVNEDGETCTIRGIGDAKASKVVIPEEIDGYRVTAIAGQAFKDCDWISSVSIPKTLEKIGSKAFSGCGSIKALYIDDLSAWCNIEGADGLPTSLESLYIDGELVADLVIPGDVTKIEEFAFAYFESIEKVTISEGVTEIGDYAFTGSKNLTCVVIPNSVTTLGNSAFSDCSSLTSVALSNNITSIGEWAFASCENLTAILFPNSVTSIGDWAFSGCKSLTDITIPDTVTKIGRSAFADCDKLGSITIPFIGITPDDKYGLLEDIFGYSVPASLKDVVITAGTHISSMAFYGCENLVSITLPDGITSISSNAFYDCKSLTNLNIPDSITSIGSSTFEKCTSLQYNTYGNCLYLGNDNNPYLVLVKASDENITSCTIHQDTKLICGSAFSNCYDIMSFSYDGTLTDWDAVMKEKFWLPSVLNTTFIACSNGKYSLF